MASAGKLLCSPAPRPSSGKEAALLLLLLG